MMKTIGTDATAIEVLLVEDSPGDIRLTREAFKDAKVHINLHVASDGAEAMDFLNRRLPRSGIWLACCVTNPRW
jgi:two-component system, chemotaxis family, response regulator Rcp1